MNQSVRCAFCLIASLLMLMNPACIRENSHPHPESGTATPKPEAVETAQAQPTEAHLFTPDQFVAYTDAEVPKVFETTRWIYDDPNEKRMATVVNQTIDYGDLSIAVTAFDPTSQKDALKLEIKLPDDWEEDLVADMMRNVLHFRFELDGKQIDAFRNRVLRAKDSHLYEVIYQSCLIPDLPNLGRILSIRPYAEYIRKIWIREKGDQSPQEAIINLDKGETYRGLFFAPVMREAQRSSLTWIGMLDSERCYLDQAAVSIQLHAADPFAKETSKPIAYQISYTEKSEEQGTEEELIEVFSSYSVHEVDFSDAVFALEALHIDDRGYWLQFTWRYPDVIPEQACRALTRSDLNFYAYFDDDVIPEEWSSLDGFPAINESENAPFGDTRTLIGRIQYFQRGFTDYDTEESCREIHVHVYGSMLTKEQWMQHNTLYLVPYHYLHVGKYDVALVVLSELTIQVELTPELYENSF